MVTPKDIQPKVVEVKVAAEEFTEAVEKVVAAIDAIKKPPVKTFVRKEHLEQRPFRNREMAQLRDQLVARKPTNFKNRKR